MLVLCFVLGVTAHAQTVSEGKNQVLGDGSCDHTQRNSEGKVIGVCRQHNSRVLNGELCTPSCVAGYVPSKGLICVDGELSPSKEICHGLPCEFEMVQQQTQIRNLKSPKRRLEHNDNVTTECKDGFKLTGISNTFVVCDAQQLRFHPNSACRPVNCSTESVGPNLLLSSDQCTPVYGSECEFQCDEGWIVEGKHSHQSFTAKCGASGEWEWQDSPSSPECRRVKCLDIHSHIKTQSGFSTYHRVNRECSNGNYYQSKCDVVCGEGSEGKQSQLTCGRNAQWIGDVSPCRKCGIGKYSDSDGGGDDDAHKCVECPLHSSTNTLTGATRKDQCVCDEGYERSSQEESFCTPCGIGYFRSQQQSQSDELKCQKCPPNSITRAIGSKSLSDCECDLGYFSADGTSHNCQKCGADTFKSQIGSQKCRQCREHSTTQGHEGSTSHNHCLCSAGYFLNNISSICEACPESHFKEGNGNGTCELCPQNHTTNGRIGQAKCDFIPEFCNMTGLVLSDYQTLLNDSIPFGEFAIVQCIHRSTWIRQIPCNGTEDPYFDVNLAVSLECPSLVRVWLFPTVIALIVLIGSVGFVVLPRQPPQAGRAPQPAVERVPLFDQNEYQGQRIVIANPFGYQHGIERARRVVPTAEAAVERREDVADPQGVRLLVFILETRDRYRLPQESRLEEFLDRLRNADVLLLELGPLDSPNQWAGVVRAHGRRVFQCMG
eukprot:c10132_g1_i1.p1 GENE.c10132_g1_i1~~c10132_g1_i1.p1  ORF type:complete len:728 (-),score=158.64 c10132_g1_i1:61-2211(-)